MIFGWANWDLVGRTGRTISLVSVALRARERMVESFVVRIDKCLDHKGEEDVSGLGFSTAVGHFVVRMAQYPHNGSPDPIIMNERSATCRSR
jgi:hypothetical protein